MYFILIVLCNRQKSNNFHFILISLLYSIVNDIAPEETEDEGAGDKEMEDGDLDLANSEGEAEKVETGWGEI